MPSHIANNKIINRFKVSNRKFIYLQELSSVCSKNNLFRIAKKKKKMFGDISSPTN